MPVGEGGPPSAASVDAAEGDELGLRRADEEDLAAIAELFLRARAAAVPSMPPVPEHPEDTRRAVRGWDLADPATREVWVATTGGSVVGYVVLTGSWLDALYVDQAHQRRGVGSALLHLVTTLRPDGFELWVFATNAPARAFYRRHGLLELETTDGSGNAESAPDVRVCWPGADQLGWLRARIDTIDSDLAELLSERFALAAAVQTLKARTRGVAGSRGRDPERERAIVARMARHAPAVPESALSRILAAVIEEGLAAWEDGQRTP